MIEIKPVQTNQEKRTFLTFPWMIYRDDPLWAPPLLAERAKAIDPRQGLFFKDGTADLLLAWKDGVPAGTLCLAEDRNSTRTKDFPECMYGFVECIEDFVGARSTRPFWAGISRPYSPVILSFASFRYSSFTSYPTK